MSTPWSRRAPYPWSLEVDVGDGKGWQGLMLKPTREGFLTGRASPFLEGVSPTTYEYGAARPDEETTFLFGRLTGGMGERVQSSSTSRRYYYAQGVDCSIGGIARLGPAFTAATLPAALASPSSVRQIVVGPGASGDQLFLLRGQEVDARVAGTWSLSHDFTAGNQPNQAVVFQGTAGTRGLWVATTQGQLWKFDGTTWTQATLPAGASAQFVERVEGELFVGAGAYVRVCTADPLLAASWGGAIQVGDLSTSITYLKAVDDVLFVFKADGVYTLNADGSDNDLTPELRPQAAATNGVGAVAWRDRLWFPYGDAYYSLGSSGAFTPVGPERLAENDSPVRGLAVSATPHADWFLYLGLYNPATSMSYLLKHGTWLPDQGTDATGAYRFADVWHGSIAEWSKRVTRLDVDYLGTNPVLWVGFADGSLESAVLPARTPDPALDPACRFAGLGGGWLWAPAHDDQFGADVKAFHGMTALGPRITTAQRVSVRYRVDPPLFGGIELTLGFFTAPGQRLEFPDLTTPVARDESTGRQLLFRLGLETTDATLTPIVEGVGLHEAVRPDAARPALRVAWSATVRGGNRIVRRDGVLSRTRAEAIVAAARTMAQAAGHVLVRFPDGVVRAVAAVEYAAALHPEEGRDGLEVDIPLRLVTYRTVPGTGTLSGLL